MKVGLIGAGLQGRRRARAITNVQGTEISIIADIDLSSAKSLAKEVGCDAVVDWEKVVTRDDVEAVIVCTPPHLHAPISIAAIGVGKHVLCEKPLARNPDEAKKILDAATKSKVKLKCGFNLRQHPGIAQARRWFDEGMIGTLSFVRCRYGIAGRPGYEKEWRAKVDISGGGQLMDQGVHVIDLCRWFMGDLSEAVGFISTSFWDIAQLEDNAFGLLRTDSGQVASLHVSWTQWKNLFSLEIFGTEGYITVEGLGGSYGVEKAAIGKRPQSSEPFIETVIEFRGDDISWREEWKEFLTAIEQNRRPLGDGYDGWQALRIIYALYESARIGTVVSLKP